MVSEIEYTRPKLADYQTAIIDSPARYTVTEASTKIGKTASHIVWALEQSLMLVNNQIVWWISPVYKQAEIAFNRMRAQISDKGFFKVNESKLRLTTPTGSIIQFNSAEKPDNLYGEDVYAAVFDEFTRAREEAWFAVRSTLTKTKGKCKLIGNVKGKKNWGYRLAQRAKAGEEGYEYFKLTAYDAVKAGILELGEVDQAKKDLPEVVFRELYLAEASDDGSNPFGYDAIRRNIAPLSNASPKFFGIDLAKSFDYTVIIGIDDYGTVCYFERFQKDWKQTRETILSLPNVPTLIDSTGVGDPIVEDIQREKASVEGFKYGAQSKQQIMEGLALSIQRDELKFPDGHITAELESFEFSHTRTGVRYEAPEGSHDDCVNALALANSIRKSKYGTPLMFSFISGR